MNIYRHFIIGLTQVTAFGALILAGWFLVSEAAIHGGSHNLIRDMWPEPLSTIDCGGDA